MPPINVKANEKLDASPNVVSATSKGNFPFI